MIHWRHHCSWQKTQYIRNIQQIPLFYSRITEQNITSTHPIHKNPICQPVWGRFRGHFSCNWWSTNMQTDVLADMLNLAVFQHLTPWAPYFYPDKINSISSMHAFIYLSLCGICSLWYVYILRLLWLLLSYVYLSASALSCFSSEESYGFAKLTVSDRSVCFWGCICFFKWLLWHKEDVMIYIWQHFFCI